MNRSILTLCLFPLTVFVAELQADLSVKTDFNGAEGYTVGDIDKSVQKRAPLFASQGGLYFPKSQGPDFGVLRRNPTSQGSRAILTQGEGSGFKPGSTWSTRLSYTFEGLPAMVMGGKAPVMLGGLGFTNSQTEVKEPVYVGIQKTPQQSDSYQFYVFGQGGGGFFVKNVSYDSIGDDLSDADDLSDTIAIDFTVTKSAKAGVLEFVATLSNLDKGTEVVSLSGELKAPKLYNKNLYAYVSSGAVKEDANYDLFNLHALSYKTVEK